MENPLSGVMEWYQGLPQAAQIGIPVVGAGAVFLIARGKGSGGGTGGSVVAGPFGSSAGGGGGGGGNTPPPTPTPKPKPKPVPHPKPIPPVHPGGHRPPHPPKPVPPGGHKPWPPIRPISGSFKPEPIHHRPPIIAPKGHLPSSHIQMHPALGKPHLPSSHIMSAPNTKAGAVGYIAPQDQSKAKEAWSHAAAQANRHVTDTKVVPQLAKHPVRNKGLHNTVTGMKGHQYVNDQHKAASSVLAKRNNNKPVAL